VPVALTIAGSDPGGGAGIQADLKTFHRFGVYGTAVVTLITVQNTVRMSRVETLDAALVAEQIGAVFEDLPPQAVKTGALGTAAIIDAIVDSFADASATRRLACPLVVDPVMLSSHGPALADASAAAALQRLIGQAALVTPNLAEAARLAGIEVATTQDMREAARRIAALGARAVLVKGGHLSQGQDAIDILWSGGRFTEYASPRILTRHTHGTGCTYSAAITALLARGVAIEEAVRRAKRFIDAAIATSPGLGRGAGPLNHWADDAGSL